jgi:hypothetical protein
LRGGSAGADELGVSRGRCAVLLDIEKKLTTATRADAMPATIAITCKNFTAILSSELTAIVRCQERRHNPSALFLVKPYSKPG